VAQSGGDHALTLSGAWLVLPALLNFGSCSLILTNCWLHRSPSQQLSMHKLIITFRPWCAAMQATQNNQRVADHVSCGFPLSSYQGEGTTCACHLDHDRPHCMACAPVLALSVSYGVLRHVAPCLRSK
jgi:hypothetical protein